MTYRAWQATLELCARPARALLQSAQRQLARLEPPRAKEPAKKSRRARKMEERRLRRRKERGYDFWARVRAERKDEYNYEIPETNRKSALRSRLVGRGTWTRFAGDEDR